MLIFSRHSSLNTRLGLSVLTVSAFLLVSSPVKADYGLKESAPMQFEEMPPMDGANMQYLVEKMNQMQACVSELDPQAMHEAEVSVTQAYNEITALCHKDKRDLAQQHALQFAEEMQSSETLKKIEECTLPLRGLLPTMPFMGQSAETLAKQNICDIIEKP